MNDFGKRQDSDGRYTSRQSEDAELIAYSINKGWVMRGFKLGIGFWLAGVFITVVGAVIAFVFWSLLAAQFYKAGTASRTDAPPPAYSDDTPPPVNSDGKYY